jgi:hypothetical protein
MIDTGSERLIKLARAGRIANPSNPPHASTIWRWAGRGVRHHVLESVLIGGVRFTSAEAVQRFITSLNRPGDLPPPPPSKRAVEAGRRLAKRLAK